jgi:transposase
MGLPLATWSVRTLALQLVEDGSVTQIHYSSVCLILQEAECQPHRTLYWKRGHDPEFEPKALHVLWYYENAARLAAKGEQVFCVDEKPGIQLLGRLHPDQPTRPGCPLRREFEYVRHGTGTLLMFLNLPTGKIFTRTPNKKNSQQLTALFDAHLKTIPKANRVHYILDNDPTHVSAHTRNWLASKKGRVRLHYTPKYASWLNQSEIALGNFSRYYLRNRVWRSKNEFPAHVRVSTRHYNRQFAHPFDWSFTRNRFHEWMHSKTCSTGH